MKISGGAAVTRLCCGGLLVAAVQSAASADLRLTAEVHITRTADPAQSSSTGPTADETKTITGFFRGDKARIETASGDTVLYDLAARRVYLLNAADKTYTILTIDEYAARNRSMEARRLISDFSGSDYKPEVKTDLKKDAVVESRTFAGKQAHLFNLSEMVTFRPEIDENAGRGSGGGGFPGGRGGGRRRGGGFPGGGGGGDRSSAQRPRQATGGARIEGEVWLADSVAGKMKAKHLTLPLFMAAVPSEPALFALSDKIAKSNAFPVSSKITTAWRSSRSGSDAGPSTTVVTDVTAISEEPLDDGLFKVPTDYAKSGQH